jgi:hypothetical protein
MIQVDEQKNIETHFFDIENYKKNKSIYRALLYARNTSLEVSMDKLLFRKTMYKNIMKKKVPCKPHSIQGILKRNSSYW